MEQLTSFIEQIFGLNAEELSTWHILVRCLFIYILGIALVRLGNKRFVGRMSAFDFLLAIIIGSMLSRAITSSTQFFSILAACLLLILLHRSFSAIAARSDKFGNWIKGSERVIVRDGEILWKEMRKSNLSEQDLIQNLRLNANLESVKEVKEARLERNGDISVIKKNS
jgi:uncharacterized membrane protein YcaP (DUF421 family)